MEDFETIKHELYLATKKNILLQMHIMKITCKIDDLTAQLQTMRKTLFDQLIALEDCPLEPNQG